MLGIALIAMGEDIGAEMSLRSFNHLVGGAGVGGAGAASELGITIS